MRELRRKTAALALSVMTAAAIIGAGPPDGAGENSQEEAEAAKTQPSQSAGILPGWNTTPWNTTVLRHGSAEASPGAESKSHGPPANSTGRIGTCGVGETGEHETAAQRRLTYVRAPEPAVWHGRIDLSEPEKLHPAIRKALRALLFRVWHILPAGTETVTRASRLEER